MVDPKELKNRLKTLWGLLEEEGFYTKANTVELVENYIQEIESENIKLKIALDLYERERERFRHNTPELIGQYFLAGGHGNKDQNNLPDFVRICPAYGCAWEQVYTKTDQTISYEGS